MRKSVQKLLFSLLIVILNLALLVQANSVELEDKPLFSITSDSNSLVESQSSNQAENKNYCELEKSDLENTTSINKKSLNFNPQNLKTDKPLEKSDSNQGNFEKNRAKIDKNPEKFLNIQQNPSNLANLDSFTTDALTKKGLEQYFSYTKKNYWRTPTPEELEYIKLNKGRWPPNNFMNWVEFGKEKQCPSLEFFMQIFDDFLPFYQLENGSIKSIVTQEMLEKPYCYSNIIRVSIRNHNLQSTWGLNANLENHINEIINLLPKDLDFPYNYYNDDSNLPADDGDEAKPYLNPNDTLERNECLRNTYNDGHKVLTPGTVAYTQGAFVAPPAFVTSHEVFPVLSQGKKSCFKDLIFPIPNSLKLSKDWNKWESKKSKMIWRGSNTGTRITNNSLHHLSPRYRLVDWATNSSEYVKSTLGIDLDIGFYQIHQCDNQSLCEEAKNKTRIRPYRNYRE